jgi:hypothetical protein
MDFPGAQELAQGLALEWAALMEVLARIQHYICVIAVVALIVYLTYAAWFRLKQTARWGDPTYDEMMAAIFEYTMDNQ